MIGRRIGVILHKEWLDMRKNRMVLLMLFLLPLIMVAMILGTTWLMVRMPEQVNEPILADDAPGLPPALAAMDPLDRSLAVLNDQYMFYLLLLPMAMPVYIAAYSIIGEKEARSLEPLLATPISTGELLLAKIAAASAPAVVAAWASFGITVLGTYLLASPAVVAYLVRPLWTVGMLVHSPLFAVLSASGGVIASSRLNDPRAAQQVTALFIVPLIGVSLAVLMGKVYLNTLTLVWATPVVLALDAAVIWVAVRLFQRETILTRWK
jgi:ABC-2 type transport system permease protein